nr:Putative glucuronoxylan glucuronosyltransferase F8H [Ipomoea trifida]
MLNKREQCVFVGKAQNTQIVLLQRLVALRSSKHINLSMQSSYSNLSMVSDWTKADPDVFTTNTSKPGWCNVDPDEASASKRSAIVSMMDLGADSVSVRCLFRALVSINALGIAYAEVDFVRRRVFDLLCVQKKSYRSVMRTVYFYCRIVLPIYADSTHLNPNNPSCLSSLKERDDADREEGKNGANHRQMEEEHEAHRRRLQKSPSSNGYFL